MLHKPQVLFHFFYRPYTLNEFLYNFILLYWEIQVNTFFMDEETEAQRGKINFQKSNSIEARTERCRYKYISLSDSKLCSV